MGKRLGTKIYMGKMEGVKLVIVKEFNEGELTKHVNNNGKLSSNDSEILKKAERKKVWSRSEKVLMILDMQSSGYHLFQWPWNNPRN